MRGWKHVGQMENWLLGGTGTSVATIASFTMRRLSTLGSVDSDSILRAHANGCEHNVQRDQETGYSLDVHRLMTLEEREGGRARERLLDVSDNVVASEHPVLRGEGGEGEEEREGKFYHRRPYAVTRDLDALGSRRRVGPRRRSASRRSGRSRTSGAWRARSSAGPRAGAGSR